MSKNSAISQHSLKKQTTTIEDLTTSKLIFESQNYKNLMKKVEKEVNEMSGIGKLDMKSEV